MSGQPARLTRRNALLGAALSALFGPACASAVAASAAKKPVSPLDPTAVTTSLTYEDNVDALLDVLVPADRDPAGLVTSPGAREVAAGRLFGDEELVALVTGLGFLPPLMPDVLTAATTATGGLRAALNAFLDLRAARVAPLTHFSDLTAHQRLAVVDDAYADDTARPLVELVRVVAFVGYLGAVYADVGLVAVGFPPYEDFAAGLAVSGYPRTTDGKPDDYTYDEAPGDFQVALGLDDNGDLP